MDLVVIIIVTILGYGLSLLVSRYFGILDKPGPDVPKRSRVPTIQGLTAFLIPLCIVLVYRPMDIFGGSGPFLGLWLGLVVIVLVTLLDELGRIVSPKLFISPIVRLFVQLAAIIFAWIYSGVAITEFTWINGFIIEFGWFSSIVFTVGWFLLFINAINRFDGIYGLATGMSSIGFLTIAGLLTLVVIPGFPEMSLEKSALLSDVSWYAILFFVVTAIGAIVEFRPSGVMRDVGTMAFGFALAYLALLGGAKIGTIIVVLMLPLFDAVWVIIDRLHKRRKNPLYGDYSHLHYRLLALGRDRTEIRVFIWGVSIFFVVLMLLQGVDRFGKIVIFLMVACIFFGVNWYLYWKKGLPREYDRKKFTQINKK